MKKVLSCRNKFKYFMSKKNCVIICCPAAKSRANGSHHPAAPISGRHSFPDSHRHQPACRGDGKGGQQKSPSQGGILILRLPRGLLVLSEVSLPLFLCHP